MSGKGLFCVSVAAELDVNFVVAFELDEVGVSPQARLGVECQQGRSLHVGLDLGIVRLLKVP